MENEAMNTNANEPKQHGLGGIVGTLIIIVILIAGGWYFVSNRVEKIQDQKALTEVGDLKTGTSTEITDIQADLNNLNLDALDLE
jgi:preprotein translocase subunit YajC